ncbi:class I SAM-dependent methyltransferase [Cohaesibacter intestini]|uniref:class I SAM-dependent methyltransferase n=1 Tax=Cohaesibacter intestini TaxID=2211145 RepID=UPI000DE83D9F|nr:class I SAM-dependent methyltransferase [Cohaesibacter intestini]
MSETTPKSAVFWDKLARRYAARPISNVEAYEQTLDRVRHYLSTDASVLELGCGTGSTALLLASHVGQYRASDISGEMIAIANEKLAQSDQANLEFVKADLYAESLDEQAPYDALLAFNVIHLFEDTPDALKRINGLIKPDGLLISKTVCLSGLYGLLRIPIFFMQLFGKAPPVRFISAKRLARMMREAGFEIVEEGNFAKVKMAHFVVARKVR